MLSRLVTLTFLQDTTFSEDCLYQPGKKGDDVVDRLASDVDSVPSSPGSVANRHSFDQSTNADTGNEPTWVKEIGVDEESDTSSCDEVDGTISSWEFGKRPDKHQALVRLKLERVSTGLSHKVT